MVLCIGGQDLIDDLHVCLVDHLLEPAADPRFVLSSISFRKSGSKEYGTRIDIAPARSDTGSPLVTSRNAVMPPSHVHEALMIVAARITPQPLGPFDWMPVVWATFDHGGEHPLFAYCPDEVSFAVGEFVGLTKVQAVDLLHHKVNRHLANYQKGRSR